MKITPTKQVLNSNGLDYPFGTTYQPLIRNEDNVQFCEIIDNKFFITPKNTGVRTQYMFDNKLVLVPVKK